ncbi:aminotransferase class I/II-fold pyridoxal phosphate-dependent enzyme [Streptomyces sp. 3MP-14]|uniref:Aminotransferase class I/II-fold pyridoxal phosphate-dependent enzyme n=1 Tax=Streptomyces mimosae TaxID=2586635 RepID=A0A5N6A4Y9_9ACTN|nr:MULTISPECIES: PLP-dependent aminotransferase family protein [Streptomyces]KAB8163312.1 aminotransferase class I/II-fold pyridoxal phosphate-dependent enzyme [Streptomyces mimosae]KAB8174589.1 aminotransferase class I/II-fold pyridoxal phosphate-dependent enzyme [Streptomyces sp. 3MP-14]
MDRSKDHGSEESKEPLGSDFLQLDMARAPAGGRAEWLAGQLRRAIADGLLPVGGRLPATRTLAAELRVSRGVVTAAYRRLMDEGQVAGQRRNGTVVVAAPVRTTEVETVQPPSTADPFDGAPRADVFDALRAAPARIDLSPGLPDLAAFPRAAWLRTERALLADLPAADLGYGDPRGTPALRRAVANWLARNRGVLVHPDEVLIVAGTAQSMSLLGPLLRREGLGEIAVEDPGSLGARQHLQHSGLTTPPLTVDEEGARVAELTTGEARAVLLTPAHQFPTGTVLSGRRRRELVAWARERNGLVVEDDYDAEHRYDRPPVAAIRSMVVEHVCYFGSVSKILSPALRVGWLVAPPRWHEALVAAKRFADLGNAVLPQLVLARLMESGELERHLRLVRRRHRARRDAMIAALRAHLPRAVVHGAAAGLHLTVTLPAGLDDTALAARALARGVRTQPLGWHRQRPGPPGLVLGYAASAPSAIAEGVAVVGRALREAG